MTVILDTSAILAGIDPGPSERTLCPPGVYDECRSRAARLQLEQLERHGLRVLAPSAAAVATVTAAAERLGEDQRLSATDIEVLALALEHNGTLYSDDYAIQNLATTLDIDWTAIGERGITTIRSYGYRCKGCGKRWSRAPKSDDCPICGSAIRPVPKTKRAHRKR